MRYLCCFLTCLLCAASAWAADPADGIYAAHADGQGRRVRRDDGAIIVLGDPLGTGFGQATLVSVANDNSLFVLQLKNAGPVGAGLKPGSLTVVIDGVCAGVRGQSGQHPDGTLDLSAHVHGENEARQVAARLKIRPQLRENTGHRFEVRWKPEKDQFQAGETVKLTMEVRNTGEKPFTYQVGGKQR